MDRVSISYTYSVAEGPSPVLFQIKVWQNSTQFFPYNFVYSEYMLLKVNIIGKSI